MKLIKILIFTSVALLFACSEQNSKPAPTEQSLMQTITSHFSQKNDKEKRFENLAVKIINTEESSNESSTVYKSAYQVSMDLAEDLYKLKSKKSCDNPYVTYNLLHTKGSKHVINGTLVAEYKMGSWEYSFKNDNEIDGNRLPESPNLFAQDSIEEIDFIKQSCKKLVKEKQEAEFAKLQSKVIVIEDESYNEFELAAKTIDGKKIYASECAGCHDTGESGAPRLDNNSSWHPQLDTVKKALLQNILIAEDSKHPRAGIFIASEAEILASINYMLNKLKKNQEHSH